MNREEFIEIKGKNKSPSTVLNYKKALKKFDMFLESRNKSETDLLNHLNQNDSLVLCKTMQDIIDYLSNHVSARVVKEYFGIIESYFAFLDLTVSESQKRLRISMPRESKPRFEGLDQSMIKRILEFETDPLMQAYYSCGFGAGMRETEILLLKPSMIRFNENPVRLVLPKEITKFSIPRETFLAQIPAQRLKTLVWSGHLQNDDLIFTKKYTESTLIEFEKHFARIRKGVGYDTPNRKPHQQNDITLHSFRAFFTTSFMDAGYDWFGLAITGHTKYMDTYFRKSLPERQNMFMKVHDSFNF